MAHYADDRLRQLSAGEKSGDRALRFASGKCLRWIGARKDGLGNRRDSQHRQAHGRRACQDGHAQARRRRARRPWRLPSAIACSSPERNDLMRVAQFSEFGGTSGASPRGGGGAEPRPRRRPHQGDGGRPQLLRHAVAAQPVPGDPAAPVLARSGDRRQRSKPLAPNVTDFKLGQRVVAFIGGNGCREKVVTKAKNAVPIPDGVSDEVAAGIPDHLRHGAARLEGPRRTSRRARPWRCSARPEARVSPPSRSPSSWARA